ncbi:MAG: hypothetical protein ABI992_13245, partial [Chthoniobacterales bacterium]
SMDGATVTRLGAAAEQLNRRRPDQAQRNAHSLKKAEFMDAKSDGKQFKRIATEPDKRRK